MPLFKLVNAMEKPILLILELLDVEIKLVCPHSCLHVLILSIAVGVRREPPVYPLLAHVSLVRRLLRDLESEIFKECLALAVQFQRLRLVILELFRLQAHYYAVECTVQLRREPLNNCLLESFRLLIPRPHLFLQDQISVVKFLQVRVVLVLEKLLLLMSDSDQTQGGPVCIPEDVDFCL